MIDARWLNTGLGAYTLHIIRGIHEFSPLPLKLLTLPQHCKELQSYPYEIVLSSAGLYSLREQFEVMWAARDCEVLHVPHYNAPISRRKSLLVTIHDLNHILDQTMRKSLKSQLYARPMLRLVANRADQIFTVSEYSKRQIVEHLGADPAKVVVTYSGVPPHIFPEPREESRRRTNQRFGFEGNYLLFVGNLKPNKNLSGLLKGFSILLQRRKLPLHLLVIGNDREWKPVLLREVADLGLDTRVVFAQGATDEEVRAAYSGADLTVLPSFEEGFGLPVVESMACGTPVACSNVASLPEVGGDAAEYFSPAETESMVSAFENVLLSRERWTSLQQLGYQQAAKFGWRECAKRHIPVYQQFLSRN